MKWIEDLLRRKIGLDAASVGSSLIQRAIRLRMKALGLATLETYRDWLVGSEPEWVELIEGVVVTETWFFRDREPFSAFIQLVQTGLESRVQSPESKVLRLGLGTQDSGIATPNFSATVRILSLPCSTGEEPYSLAMALLGAGVPRPRFVIDAVDISARALERARQAIYGKNSFRGQSLQFRDRYFSPIGNGWKLYNNARDCVQFHRGNLLAGDFSASLARAPYDFIFCRNLLIYFDRVTQARALRQLDGLLAPHGVLFVGPAELPLVSDRGFVSAGLPMAFACRKPGTTKESGAARWVAPRPPLNNPPRGELRVPSSPRPRDSKLTPPSAVSIRAAGALDLNAAHALADAGKLAEAAALCEAHLKSQGPSAQVYYLIGLVNEARLASQVSGLNAPDSRLQTPDYSSALDFYRKALYLEPNHHETLLQMSLLLAKLGDASGAQTFRRRALRAGGKLKVEG